MLCVCVDGTAAGEEIDTETNLTISQADSDMAVEPMATMTDSQLTARLYRRLTDKRQIGVDAKLPTLDDV